MVATARLVVNAADLNEHREKIEATPSDDMSRRFNGGTITDNLAQAVKAGKVLVAEDGWSLPAEPPPAGYLIVKTVLPLDCIFLNGFLFRYAYARAAVPFGCRTCFKVKIIPRTFRGLIALLTLLEAAPYHSKCGVDLYNPHSPDIYAGFLYLDGLDEARVAWRAMRPLVDAEPALGPATVMTIKRGCSNYEAACGPSDSWHFDDNAAGPETALREQFHPPATMRPDYGIQRATKMVEWMQVAYRTGDDSYRDFTGGRPLHRPTVNYPPEPVPEGESKVPSSL